MSLENSDLASLENQNDPILSGAWETLDTSCLVQDSNPGPHKKIMIKICPPNPLMSSQIDHNYSEDAELILEDDSEVNEVVVKPMMMENSKMSIDETWADLLQDQQDSNSNDSMSNVIDPRVAEGLDTFPLQIESENDLLGMVMNDTIEPNDPKFQEFIQLQPQDEPQPCTSQQAQLQIKEELQDPSEFQPVKRGRGRPKLPRIFAHVPTSGRKRGRPATASLYANLENYDSSTSALSDDDFRYKRMRSLNNAASKRCRLNRKKKFEDMEAETKFLEVKNAELNSIVSDLEAQVQEFKSKIFKLIEDKKGAKKAEEKNIDMRSAEDAGGSNSGSSSPNSVTEQILPDVLNNLDSFEFDLNLLLD